MAKIIDSMILYSHVAQSEIAICYVATRGAVGDWTAYAGAVPSVAEKKPGDLARFERQLVVRVAGRGFKLDKVVALAIFPQIAGEYRR